MNEEQAIMYVSINWDKRTINGVSDHLGTVADAAYLLHRDHFEIDNETSIVTAPYYSSSDPDALNDPTSRRNSIELNERSEEIKDNIINLPKPDEGDPHD